MSRLITWNKDKYYNYSEILKNCKLTFKAWRSKQINSVFLITIRRNVHRTFLSLHTKFAEELTIVKANIWDIVVCYDFFAINAVRSSTFSVQAEAGVYKQNCSAILLVSPRDFINTHN